jgi:hypothetical protein
MFLYYFTIVLSETSAINLINLMKMEALYANEDENVGENACGGGFGGWGGF